MFENISISMIVSIEKKLHGKNWLKKGYEIPSSILYINK